MEGTYTINEDDVFKDFAELMGVRDGGEIEEIDIEDYRIDPDEDFIEPDFTVSMAGVPTIPRGDIQAVKAKSKNGKSMFCCIICAAALGDTAFDTKALIQDAKVIYIDTEQNRRNANAIYHRIKALLKNPDDAKRLDVYSLRDVASADPQMRLIKIVELITEKKPTLVIIDGIADLIADFNDIGASQTLIALLMAVSSKNKTAIVNVLHTNKDKRDTNMKGHLGTLLLQKASDVFEVNKITKDGNDLFSIKETDCRNKAVPPIAFTLDDKAVPSPAQPPVKKQKNHKPDFTESIMANVEKVLTSPKTKHDLIKEYKELTKCSERTAIRHFDKIKNRLCENNNLLSLKKQ